MSIPQAHEGQVSSTCLSLLLQELVPTAVRVTHLCVDDRHGADIDYQTRIDTPLSSANDLPGTTAIYQSDHLISDDTSYRVEIYGYNMGMRLAEYLMFKLPNDLKIEVPLDVMKFLCRELWKALYGKQINSLRTNHRGTYVLIDKEFRSIARFSSPNNAEELEAIARIHLQFPCGIIRGVLKSFGIEANVTAEIKEFPTVEFSIQTPEHE